MAGFPRRRFAPGSLAWLVFHRQRLDLRATQGRSPLARGAGLLVLGGFFVAGLVMFGTAGFATSVAFGEEAAGMVHAAGLMGLCFVLFSGLSTSIMAGVTVLSDRGDLDLLLASPVPARRLGVARLVSSAIRVAGFNTAIALMIYGVTAATRNPALFLSVLAVTALSALVTAAGFAIVRGLLFRFGLIRGRTVANLIGMGMLVATVTAYPLVRGALGRADIDPARDLPGWALWLGSGMTGAVGPALVLILAGFGGFALLAAYSTRDFAGDAARVEAAGSRRRAGAGSAISPGRFRPGTLRAVVLKELRGLIRDPALIAQVAIPLVSMVPLSVSLATGGISVDGAGFQAAVIAGVSVVLTSQTAQTLAWTISSTEEAGDLIGASPAPARTVLAAKLMVAILPALCFVAGFAGLIAPFSPPAALAALGAGLLSALSVAAVEFWRPRPAKRVRMTQRPDRSALSIVAGIVIGGLYGLTAGLAALGSLWALAPVSLGLLVTAMLRPRRVAVAAVAAAVPLEANPWKAL